MNTSKFSLVPLQQASLCMDCDMITAAHTTCAVCGSKALLNIAKALNGDEYADPLQPELATIASIPGHRVHHTHVLYGDGPRMHYRPAGELISFPQTRSSASNDGDADLNTWWGSFRQVAAIVERAMTVGIMAIFLLGTTTKAQSAADLNAQSKTSFEATLSKSLDSKKVTKGYPVVARTAQAVQADASTTLPKGTKIVGHVIKATARANGASESVLAIRFDHAVVKSGEIPLDVTIQTIASAQSAVRELDADEAPGMTASESAMAGSTVHSAALVSGRTLSHVTNSTASVDSSSLASSNSADVNSHLVPAAHVTLLAGGAAGANAGGGVTPGAHNVIGMKGITLHAAADEHSSVVASSGRNVRLESGTHFVLMLQSGVNGTRR